MKRGRSLAVLAALAGGSLATVGCGESVPAEPTYFEHVQPILRARCVRCHGAAPIEPALDYFRLDRYVAGDELRLDVFDMSGEIFAHTVNREAPVMPPDFAITERQRTILARWVSAGAPKGERDNQLPEVVVFDGVDNGSTVDQELSLTLRATDADGDGLIVSIGTRPSGSDGSIALEGLGGGLHTISIDAGQIPSQSTIDVYAVVDDGFSDEPADNQHEVVVARDIFVDHGERGTAPTVTLLSPNGGETLIGSADITWSATDPDPGDELTIDLALVEVGADGSETVAASVATDLPNTPSLYAWDLADVPASDASGQPIRYRVRVTATDLDAKNTRSDASDATFTVAQGGGSTELTWTDVKPIFVTYCLECHGADARNASIEYFRLDKYDAADPEPPQNSDDGVYEVRGLVYDRMIVTGNMPPAAKPQPSADELATVEEWLLAGAPHGDGGDTQQPTFTWLTPNDSTITTTSTGDVTLAWSADSNPPGGTITGSIEVAELNATNDQQAFCTDSLTGWAEIGTDVAAGSLGWTAPAPGYFCMRGTVTDEMGQSTTAVAGRPVKYATGGPPN